MRIQPATFVAVLVVMLSTVTMIWMLGSFMATPPVVMAKYENEPIVTAPPVVIPNTAVKQPEKQAVKQPSKKQGVK